MKTFNRIGILMILTVGIAAVSYAQKDNVKAAERLAKSKDHKFEEARMLMQQALQNPETKNDPKTFYIAGFVEENQFTSENIKQIDGTVPDKKVMNKALLDMYDYYKTCYDMEHGSNASGKVKTKYTKNILKAFQDNLLYFINAGGYYFEVKDFESASKAFNDFKEIKKLPDFQGQPFAAIDSNSMTVDFFAVISAYQAGNKQEAIKLAEEIKNVPFRQDELYQVLAQTQYEVGDTAAYINTMKEGMTLFPEQPYYSVNLINTYISTNRTPEAISTLEEAIKRSPNNAQLYDVMGKLYENDDIDKSIECFKKAMEVDPNFNESYFNLGRVYYNKAVELKSGDKITPESEAKAKEYLEKSLPLLQKAYESDPEGTYYLLGTVYYNLGMTDKYEEITNKHKK